MVKVKLTKESKGNLFDDCDFNNVDFENEGQGNKVKNSRFNSFLQKIEKWYQKWWVKYIVFPIFVGLMLWLITNWVNLWN